MMLNHRSFVEDGKASGFVTEGPKRSGQLDTQVAPAGVTL